MLQSICFYKKLYKNKDPKELGSMNGNSEVGVHNIARINHATNVLQKFARKVIKYQRQVLKVGNPFGINNYDDAALEDAFEKGDQLKFGWCDRKILERMPVHSQTKKKYEIFDLFTSTKQYHTRGLIRFTIILREDGTRTLNFWPPDLNNWDSCIFCLFEEVSSARYCYQLYFDEKNLLSSFDSIRVYVPIIDIVSPYGYATNMDVEASLIEDDEEDIYSKPLGKQGEGGYISTNRGTKYAEIIYKKHFYCRNKVFI